MIGVKPYISFAGNCEEAMNYYKDCLGGQILGIERYGNSPMGGAGDPQKVMHCVLKVGDTVIMAADSKAPDNATTIGNNVSLAVGIDSVEDAERMFDAMCQGGKATMPLQETYWAARFGMLTDKYGINWMFNCEKPHGAMLDKE